MSYCSISEEVLETWGYVERAFAGESGFQWIRKACPRCEELDGKQDYKRSLGYNTTTGAFSCFKCHMRGRLPKDRMEALEIAEAEEANKVFQRPTEVQQAEGYIPIFEGEGGSSIFFESARSYLLRPKSEKGRGVSFGTCRDMRIGSAIFGSLAGRIIVPIPNYLEPEKPWRGWVARDYIGAGIPYRYAKGMSRDGLFWNEPALWVETDCPAFVGEGVFDAAPLWPDAVACMGKPLKSHFGKLVAAKRPIVVLLDGDAWEEGQSLSWSLQFQGKLSGSIRLPPRTDPDEVPLESLRETGRACLGKFFSLEIGG